MTLHASVHAVSIIPQASVHAVELTPLSFLIFLHSIEVSTGSMTPMKPILTTFEAIISTNTKPYAKRF
jgi:hypothetical protein